MTLDAEVVDGLVQAHVVRLDECLPHRQRHQQAVLPADVVGGEGQVDVAVGGGQHPTEVVDVEVGHARHNRVGQFGIEDEVHKHLLEAAHIPRCLEDVAVGDHQAVFAVGLERGDAVREDVVVEPVGGGPADRVKVGGSFDIGQRVADDLVVAVLEP